MKYYSRYLTQLKIYIMTLLVNVQFNHTYVTTISWWPTTSMQTTFSPQHSKTELDPAYWMVIQKLMTNWESGDWYKKIHILDNEVSDDLKKYFEETNMQFQLVPPHMHQRKAAECSVRTFKNHFIISLCTVESHFHLYLWDRLLLQVTVALNMFLQYRLNPGISTYKQVGAVHNFECVSLSTLICKV